MSFEHLPQTTQLPDEPKFILRSVGRVWRFAAFLVFSVFFTVMIYLDPASHVTVEPLLVSLGVTVIAYCWCLVPALEVTPTGLRIMNCFSVREIHWEIFRNVDSRYGLVVTSERDQPENQLGKGAQAQRQLLVNGALADSAEESSQPSQGVSAQKRSFSAHKWRDKWRALWRPGADIFANRRARTYKDSVGAFAARAKHRDSKDAPLWVNNGVQELSVRVDQVPELIYQMRELHRRIVNPKDIYLGPTERSVIARVVVWNKARISLSGVSAVAIALGVWMLLH